jgi:hypothetical protein
MLIGCAGIGTSHLLLGLAYSTGHKGLVVLALTLLGIGCYAMLPVPRGASLRFGDYASTWITSE